MNLDERVTICPNGIDKTDGKPLGYNTDPPPSDEPLYEDGINYFHEDHEDD